MIFNMRKTRETEGYFGTWFTLSVQLLRIVLPLCHFALSLRAANFIRSAKMMLQVLYFRSSSEVILFLMRSNKVVYQESKWEMES